MPLPPAPPAIALAAPEPIDLTADRLELDEATGRVTATGHVVVTRGELRLEAEALRYDRQGKGDVTGPVIVTGPAYALTAARADFDLTARTANLYGFRGTWGKRAQVRGEVLRLAEDRIELLGSSASPCEHEDPDLAIVADRFVLFPKARPVPTLSSHGVRVRAAGLDLLALPEVVSELHETDQPGLDGWIFPTFGFDAYQGFLTSTRFDFTLGPNSRGAIPIVVSTGRGLSAGIEHALGLGPGELLNAAKYETPWATGQGGFRFSNGYQWHDRYGSRYELSADYRANLNEQPVHRLPEFVWTMPSFNLGGAFSFQPELRGGYLWEQNTDVRSPRARFTAPFNTATFTGIRGYQTWLSGGPFLNQYAQQHFVGGQVAWNHRENVPWDLTFTQTLETVRTDGDTPFIHDRLIPADRVRLGVEKNWGPRLFTAVNTSWSRMNNAGPLLVEEIGLTTLYRWNCFSFQVTLRPLVWGVDTQFRLID